MSIKEEVISLIADVLKVKREEVGENASLYESLGVDSTEMVELAIALTKKLGVEIKSNEIHKNMTPLEIVEFVESKRSR